jgi:hypothetical protein
LVPLTGEAADAAFQPGEKKDLPETRRPAYAPEALVRTAILEGLVMTYLARLASCSTVVAALALPPAHAQTDHLKCYKIKDSLKVAGTADLDTPQFGLDPGCKLGPAKLFCVPGSKTNVAVVDKTTGTPIVPVAVTGPDPGDRICYKVKCQAAVPDQEVTDQFGTRFVRKFKSSLLCTPAVKGALPPTTTTITTTTTTTSTTTSTRIGVCCADDDDDGCGSDFVDPGDCVLAGGTPGEPDTVCDGATGDCLPTATPGPCCELSGTVCDTQGHSPCCLGGPDITSSLCASASGTFSTTATCDPDGKCR